MLWNELSAKLGILSANGIHHAEHFGHRTGNCLNESEKEHSRAEAVALLEQETAMKCKEITSECQAAAAKAKMDAEIAATQARTEAEAYAEKLRSEAESETTKLRNDTLAEIARLRGEAEAELKQMKNETQKFCRQNAQCRRSRSR